MGGTQRSRKEKEAKTCFIEITNAVGFNNSMWLLRRLSYYEALLIKANKLLCFTGVSHLVKYFDKALLFTPLQKEFAYPALVDVHDATLKYISLYLWLIAPMIDNRFEGLREGGRGPLGKRWGKLLMLDFRFHGCCPQSLFPN